MHRLLLIIALLCSFATTRAQSPADTNAGELSQFEGTYLFHGTDPHCDFISLSPHFYYECDIRAVEGKLRMTGFMGSIDNPDCPYYTGTYNPDEGTIYFYCGPDADGESIYDDDGTRFYVYDFTLNVGTDTEGRITLTRPGIFYFYAQRNNQWGHASFSNLSFTKDAPTPEWNGNIDDKNDPATLDDLLCYTIEFENAYKVEASGSDIRGFIYGEDGHLYAIAEVNGIIDAFGSLKIRDCRATVCFVKLEDLNPRLKDSILLGQLSPRPATPGQATVVFSARSFKIDGRLLDEEIVRTYDLEE